MSMSKSVQRIISADFQINPADKLSETKRAEKEAKEAHKAVLQANKQKNHQVGSAHCSSGERSPVACEPVCAKQLKPVTACILSVVQDKAAERAAFKEVRAISNSTSKRAAADARQVSHWPSRSMSLALQAMSANISASCCFTGRTTRQA